MASQAGRALRDLRRIAEGAKNDLREGLGPEFADLELEDLNPKRFVQKHLFDDINGDHPNSAGATAARPGANGSLLAPGERAPYDTDAT
jgi:sec-independent protein translocase protein TatB